MNQYPPYQGPPQPAGPPPPQAPPGMPPQPPPGPGMPPQPMPPQPPQKGGAGKAVGIVVGVLGLLLLVGGGGAVAWFVLGNGGSVEPKDVYPQSYEKQFDEAPSGMFVYDRDVDICEPLPTDAISSTVPFDDEPSSESVDWSDTSGYIRCSASMRGTEEYNNSVPVGVLMIDMAVYNDAQKAADEFQDDVDVYFETAEEVSELSVSGVGEQATALLHLNNGHDYHLFIQNGNLVGHALIGWSTGEEFAPPPDDVMVDMLVDSLNAATSHLL